MFSEKTANISDQARADISARGFWLTGQLAFLDVRVFNPTAKPCYYYDDDDDDDDDDYYY